MNSLGSEPAGNMGGARQLKFRCHLPNLLDEVLANPGCDILRVPMEIAKGLLARAAARAAEIDDPELNICMLNLALYDVPPLEIPEKIKKEERRLKSQRKLKNAKRRKEKNSLG